MNARHHPVQPVALFTEIHEEHDAQVIECTNHRGHRPRHRQPGHAAIDSGAQDIELAEKPGKRRHPGQREQQHQHRQRLQGFAPGIKVQRADVGHRAAILFHRQDKGKGADVHGDIDHHIDQHRLDPFGSARSQPDQRKAHMGDRGIGHQPLDIALTDGGHGTQKHRGHRQQRQHLPPLRRGRAKRPLHHPGKQRHRRHFRRGGEKGGDRGR